MTAQSAGLSQARRRPPSWRRRDRWWGWFFVAPQTIGMIVFVLIPFALTFALSFAKWSGLGPIRWIGMSNYTDQLTDPVFLRSIVNTFVIALITVPVGLGASIVVATLLEKLKTRSIYMVMFFAPVVTSSIAVAMIWQQMLRADGMISEFLATVFGITPPDWLGDPRLALIAVCMVAIWSSMGLNVVIFLAGLKNIPPSVLEAATVDGASPVSQFFRIKMPLISPIIFYSTIVAVISSFQTFDIVYVLTNDAGPDNATRTMVYHIYDVGYRSAKFGVASAASVILLLITLVVTMIQLAAQKKLVNYDL
ncbi:carbohydrate ABC transporter permease [Micropruina sp.]|uniref:carbohydrate ABC transporter permease n=1 Tax=Micropruina sp. TaxID=2737536 RepID=UPI0039E44B08